MDSRLTCSAQLWWSPDRRVTRAEGACVELLNAPPDQLVGRALEEALRAAPSDVDRLVETARAAGVVFLRSGADSSARWLRAAVATEAGEATAGLVDVQAVLLGAPPLQISSLSSSLSHEIRNPLSSVKMAVQTLARNSGLSERDQRRLTIANREIRTMERMLSLLSEYGRESGGALEPVALKGLVQESAALVELELTERQTGLEIEETSELPKVRAEPARFRPVLAQLLLNIAMGQPPGGLIPVRLFQTPQGVSLSLEDRAAALPPEEQATVFEPFGSRLARGAGLSLAALKRAMQLQKGSVSAEGGPGPGTVFTLTFCPA